MKKIKDAPCTKCGQPYTGKKISGEISVLFPEEGTYTWEHIDCSRPHTWKMINVHLFQDPTDQGPIIDFSIEDDDIQTAPSMSKNNFLATLKAYDKAERDILSYFKYERGWEVYPIVDMTELFWRQEGGLIVSDSTLEELDDEDPPDHYEEVILPNKKGELDIHRGKDFTLALVDTQCDGNIFLSIYDNAKERKK